MAYKVRTGVVLLNICDENVLAARHDAWEACPRVRPIPRLWAACWRILESGKTEGDAIEAFSTLLGKPKEEITERFDKIFKELAREGFLIEESTHEE